MSIWDARNDQACLEGGRKDIKIALRLIQISKIWTNVHDQTFTLLSEMDSTNSIYNVETAHVLKLAHNSYMLVR